MQYQGVPKNKINLHSAAVVGASAVGMHWVITKIEKLTKIPNNLLLQNDTLVHNRAELGTSHTLSACSGMNYVKLCNTVKAPLTSALFWLFPHIVEVL